MAPSKAPLFVCLVLCASACTSSSDVAEASDGGRLEREDVVDLPAGTAKGSFYEGVYEGNDETAEPTCSCEAGTCSEGLREEVSPAGVWILTQSDGKLALQMRGAINTECIGGIDADGSFWCGTERGGAQRLLITGQATISEEQIVLEVAARVAYIRNGGEMTRCEGSAAGRLSRALE